MFGKRAPPVAEHAPGFYAAVLAKFAQYQTLGNCNAQRSCCSVSGTAGLIIRGCVSLSKDKPRASFARAARERLARLRALFATDVPNVLAAKCACVLFVVSILSPRLDPGWAASVVLVVLGYGLQD